MKVHEIKEKIKTESKKLGLHFNQVLAMLAYERVIVRLLSIKELQEHLIFKGGMVMRVVYGSDRYTTDLDMSFEKVSIEKMQKDVEEALSAPLEDGFTFEVVGWSEITLQKDYPGIRLQTEFFFQKVKIQSMQLDFTISEMPDSFVQKNITLNLEHGKVLCNVYSTEQILSEKIEALVSKGSASTRSKDVYDINLLMSDKVNFKRLGKKLEQVFQVRKTERPKEFSKFFEQLDLTDLRMSWNRHKKYTLSQSNFDDIFNVFLKNMADLDSVLSQT